MKKAVAACEMLRLFVRRVEHAHAFSWALQIVLLIRLNKISVTLLMLTKWIDKSRIKMVLMI